MTTFLLVLLSVSGIFVLYTYLGYPLSVYFLQWIGFRYGVAADTASAESTNVDVLPAVTIVVVVHNAGDTIAAKLDSCLAQDYPADRLSVLVFSDGSTDGTPACVTTRGDARVRLIHRPQRRGKAACLNDAIAACTTPIVVLTDARQAIDRRAVRFLVGHFADPHVGAVSGALEIDAESGRDAGAMSCDAAGNARRPVTDAVVRSAGDYWRFEKKLRAAEAAVHSSVGATGALYALRRTAFAPLPVETILDDVLIPMNAVLAGYRISFDWRARAFDAPSHSEGQEIQRKIRTLAGNFQLFALRPALFVPGRNPIWLQFVSHKICRIVAPLALAAFLVASLALMPRHPAFVVLAIAQLVAYSIALWPAGPSRFWRLAAVRLLRGFLRLQWCAVLGFVWYLRNPQPQLWQTTRHAAVAPGGVTRKGPGP